MKIKIRNLLTAFAVTLLCAGTSMAQGTAANSVEIKQRDAAGSAWLYPTFIAQPDSALTFGTDRKPGTTALSTFARASDLTSLSASVGSLQTQTATNTGNISALQTQLNSKADIASLSQYAPVTALNSYALVTTLNSATTALSTQIAGKAPLVHTHAQSDITGLTAALAAKADASQIANLQSQITAIPSHANLATLNKISESGGLPRWNGAPWPGGSGSGSGNGGFPINGDEVNIRNPSTYVLNLETGGDGGGKINLISGGEINLNADCGDVSIYSADRNVEILSEKGEVHISTNDETIKLTGSHVKIPAGTQADDAVNKAQLDTKQNASAALSKIGESAGQPTWNGAPWPGGSGGGGSDFTNTFSEIIQTRSGRGEITFDQAGNSFAFQDSRVLFFKVRLNSIGDDHWGGGLALIDINVDYLNADGSPATFQKLYYDSNSYGAWEGISNVAVCDFQGVVGATLEHEFSIKELGLERLSGFRIKKVTVRVAMHMDDTQDISVTAALRIANPESSTDVKNNRLKNLSPARDYNEAVTLGQLDRRVPPTGFPMLWLGEFKPAQGGVISITADDWLRWVDFAGNFRARRNYKYFALVTLNLSRSETAGEMGVDFAMSPGLSYEPGDWSHVCFANGSNTMGISNIMLPLDVVFEDGDEYDFEVSLWLRFPEGKTIRIPAGAARVNIFAVKTSD